MQIFLKTSWKFCLKKWLAEKSALKFLNLFSFIYHSEFYKFPTVHFCSLIIINHSLRLSSQSLDFLNKKNDKITPLLFCAFSNRWSINFSSNFPIYVKQIEIEYQSFFINAIQTYFPFLKLQFKQASSVKNQNLKVWNDHNIHNLSKRLLLPVKCGKTYRGVQKNSAKNDQICTRFIPGPAGDLNVK